MGDVFISYAHEDRSLTAELAEHLAVIGYDVWWDQSLDAGKNVRHEIPSQLDKAKAVIVIWSRHSEYARWVANEADYALKRGKLIPVTAQGFAADKIPFGFRDENAVFWRDYAKIQRSLEGLGVPKSSTKSLLLRIAVSIKRVLLRVLSIIGFAIGAIFTVIFWLLTGAYIIGFIYVFTRVFFPEVFRDKASESRPQQVVRPAEEPKRESTPIKIADRWIEYPSIGVDASGKLARFAIYSLQTEYYWAKGSDTKLVRNGTEFAVDAIAEYVIEALGRPVDIQGKTYNTSDATDVIAVGTSSEEGGDSEREAMRALSRASNLARAIARRREYTRGIQVLNLGQYKFGNAQRVEPERQRPVLIVLVLNKEDGVNLGSALISAMAKNKDLPHPEDYKEFQFHPFRS